VKRQNQGPACTPSIHGSTPSSVRALSQSSVRSVCLVPPQCNSSRSRLLVSYGSHAPPLSLLNQQFDGLGGPVAAAAGGVEGEDLGLSSVEVIQAQTIEQQLDRLHPLVAKHGWTLEGEHVCRHDGYKRMTRLGVSWQELVETNKTGSCVHMPHTY
jgi:hypothetical protein